MPSSTHPDRQYRDMNAGAHRRPAPQIAAPALTWQMGFWRPPYKSDGLRPSEKEELLDPNHAAWWDRIDNVLLHLFLFLTPHREVHESFVSPNFERTSKTLFLFRNKSHLSPTSDGKYLLSSTRDEVQNSVRHDKFYLEVPYDGATLVISAQLHTEYFTIMFAVDFSKQVLPTKDEKQEKSTITGDLTIIWRQLSGLHHLAIDRFPETATKDVLAQLSDVQETLVQSTNLIMIRGFERYIEGVYSSAFTAEFCHTGANKLAASFRYCGDVFSDFFGVIYSLKLYDGRLAYASLPKLTDAWRYSISAQVTGSKFGNSALHAIDAIWPSVRRMTDRRSAEEWYGKPEYAAASFNDGQALYVSSLGRLVPEEPRHERERIIYNMIISYPSRWRAGRLIERINNLGVLRLAALRDLRKINIASEQINNALAKVRAYQKAEPGEANTAELREAVAKIGSDIELGLQYRVGRSLYYVGLFDELIDILKPTRIDGFQLYTNFVRSRLQDTFDYIDRVGRRYHEIQQAVSFSINWNQRQVMEGLQKALTSHTGSLKTQAEKTEANTRQAARLLTAAEFLSVVPLTYYGGHIIAEVFPPVPGFHGILGFIAGRRLFFIFTFILSTAGAYLLHRSRHSTVA